MLKNRFFTYGYVVLMSLCFCLFVAAGPTLAQERSAKVSLGGAVGINLFTLQGNAPPCSTQFTFPVVLHGFGQFENAGFPLDARVAGTYNREGWPWPPANAAAPAYAQNLNPDETPLASGPSFSATAEVLLPVILFPNRFDGKLTLSPFVGGGLNWLEDFEEGDRTPGLIVLEAVTSFIASYGVTLGYRYTNRVSFQVHVRGSSVFVGDQVYTPPTGLPVTVDTGVLSWVEGFAGVAVRL